MLAREVKTRRESVEAFRNGGREDLARKEEAEIAIIAEYLPQALTEDEIRALVGEAIAATGAASARDMGKVMGWLSPAHPRPGRRQARQRARRPGARGGRPRRPRRRPRGRLGRPAMLTQRAAPTAPFTRRDAGRFLVAAGLLVIVLTGSSRSTSCPAGSACRSARWRRPTSSRRARSRYQSALATAADAGGGPARDPAAVRLHAGPGRAYRGPPGGRLRPGASPRSTPRSTRRSSDAARAALLKAVLPSLTDSGRKTLEGLTPTAWKALRDEAANVLDQVERAELRDSDVSTVASGIASRILGDLPTDQKNARRRAHRPAHRPELGVQRVPDRAGARRGGPGGPAAHDHDPARARTSSTRAIPITPGADGEGRGPEPRRRRPSTSPGSAATLLLAMLLVSLLLAWIWRFRSEIWHRANVLLLVGLTLVFIDARAQADRRRDRRAVLRADGGRRDARRDPARRGDRLRPHGGPGGHRRDGPRRLARARDLRAPRRVRRHRRRPPRRPAQRLRRRPASRSRSSARSSSRCSRCSARAT